ncbi:MAG: hypothetical protein JNM70_05390 [Anaerolineae bacterium]|nr:hypothetical protein [Anaerolineae bacterium]
MMFDDALLEERLPKGLSRTAIRLEEWDDGHARAERRRSSRSGKAEVSFGDETEDSEIEWIRRDKRREPRYDRSKRA